MINACSMSWQMIVDKIKVSSVIQLVNATNLFYVAHILIGFTYLLMFVVVEELDSPAYPDDFQEVDVKDEPMDYDAVSFDMF